MDSRKPTPKAPCFGVAHSPRCRVPMRVPAALRTSTPAPARALGLRPGRLSSPGLGVPLEAGLACNREGAPTNLISRSAPTPGRARQAREGEVAPGLPATAAPLSRQEKFSRRGQACPLHPENARVRRLGAESAELRSEERRGEGTGTGGARTHNLAPGQPSPPPQHRPRLPRLSPFLLPPPPSPGRGAPWAPGRTDPAGVSSACASALQRLPPPGAPTFLPRTRAAREGAGGGRRQRSREEEKDSKEERTVPGEKPAPAAAVSTPPFLPTPKTRRWRRQLRKEAPVFQRHSELEYRPPRSGDSGRSAAVGSIGARSPGAGQAAGPAPSRRAGMRGRAPRRPITIRLPPGPPRACLPQPRQEEDLRRLL